MSDKTKLVVSWVAISIFVIVELIVVISAYRTNGTGVPLGVFAAAIIGVLLVISVIEYYPRHSANEEEV